MDGIIGRILVDLRLVDEEDGECGDVLYGWIGRRRKARRGSLNRIWMAST